MEERQTDDAEQSNRAKNQPRQRNESERPNATELWDEVQSEGKAHERNEDDRKKSNRCPSLPIDEFEHSVGVDRVAANMPTERARSILSSRSSSARMEDHPTTRDGGLRVLV